MGHLDYKPFAKRRRPHIHPLGSDLFVTFRLVGSIPQTTLRKYRAKKIWFESQVRRALKLTEDRDSLGSEELLKQSRMFSREWFRKFEEILHAAKTGPMWLQMSE